MKICTYMVSFVWASIHIKIYLCAIFIRNEYFIENNIFYSTECLDNSREIIVENRLWITSLSCYKKKLKKNYLQNVQEHQTNVLWLKLLKKCKSCSQFYYAKNVRQNLKDPTTILCFVASGFDYI